jgi:hypothetical protein
MNDKQKIFVMVGVGSLVVLLLTLFATDEFDLKQPFISMNGMVWDTIKTGVRHTNWFGMIAVFNIVVSITGFFLFKDK